MFTRADRLHRKGMRLEDAGDANGALAAYAEALKINPKRPQTLYNVGLIHKYRREWAASFDFNRRAAVLQPDDEATLWNLAIAATALRDWPTARGVWNRLGMGVGQGPGPIDENFGMCPVRLNPDAEAEVVWAVRVDPVRARITSIPFPETGFAHGDVVLHDGAAAGYRMRNGEKVPVFNVFELFERGGYSTIAAAVTAPAEADMTALDSLCDAARVPVEDWTANIQWLCKACSEGLPHDTHDQDLKATDWAVERSVAFAVRDRAECDQLVQAWIAGGAGRAVSIDPLDRQ